MTLVMPMNKLRAARIRAGLTQTVLAYLAQLTPSDISRFETGQARPYPSQAGRLASALGLSANELLEDSGEVHEVRSVPR